MVDSCGGELGRLSDRGGYEFADQSSVEAMRCRESVQCVGDALSVKSRACVLASAHIGSTQLVVRYARSSATALGVADVSGTKANRLCLRFRAKRLAAFVLASEHIVSRSSLS